MHIPKIKSRRQLFPKWLLVIFLIVFILRIPSFFEPFSYGDEMIYLTLGNGVKSGLTLYKDLHDNKPPLLYLTAAVAGNVFWLRMILAWWNLTSILAMSILVRGLTKSLTLQKCATAVFALLSTLPLFEGQTANAEVFMIGLTIIAFAIGVNAKTKVAYLMSGVFFSISTLFKVPAAFDLPALVIFWVITLGIFDKPDRKALVTRVVQLVKQITLLIVGFAIPIGLTLLWYWLQHALPDYLAAAFGQNVGYLSSWGGQNQQVSFLAKNMSLIIRSLLVAGGVIVALVARNKFSKVFLVSWIWIAFSVFAATLSSRPYPHYFMQVVPALSLTIAVLMTSRKTDQVLAFIPIGVVAFVLVNLSIWRYSSTGYFERFISLANGSASKTTYLEKFNSYLPTKYEVAKYITTNTLATDRVFVWGDDAAIYALTNRFPPIKYIADYHINDFVSKTAVVEALVSNPPTLVVILPTADGFTELASLVRQSYYQVADINKTIIWRHIKLN